MRIDVRGVVVMGKGGGCCKNAGFRVGGRRHEWWWYRPIHTRAKGDSALDCSDEGGGGWVAVASGRAGTAEGGGGGGGGAAMRKCVRVKRLTSRNDHRQQPRRTLTCVTGVQPLPGERRTEGKSETFLSTAPPPPPPPRTHRDTPNRRP